MRPSRQESLALRGIRYNVRHWGPADGPPVFFLHGWMDSSATFQFVVDHLPPDWHIIAPDWRGYGASTWLGRPYWFPDYYADLDALLAHYSPQAPATLVGHSMGASVAASYAGARPERVRALAMLDFLGLLPSQPDDSPGQLGAWLAAQHETPRLRVYPDHAALARRLCASNPRLSPERAAFLAQETSCPAPDGGITMACDPWHKVPSPMRYQLDDMLANWRRIACPVQLILADRGYVFERFGNSSPALQQRLDCFSTRRTDWIADAGHNLQHDQPEAVASHLRSLTSLCSNPVQA